MFTRRERGFTVVELLVVIAIIGVLVALLMPAVQMAREAARKAQCVSNMRQCAMAITNYSSAKGQLPPSRSVVKLGTPATDQVLNWIYPVLSELEQSGIHNEIRTGTAPPPTTLRILMCPSQPRFEDANYPLSYVVNGGRANDSTAPHVNFDWIENGVFIDKGVANTTGTDKHRIEEIAKYDGTSNTLMLSENPNVQGWLFAPAEQHSQMLWFPEGYQGANLPRNSALPFTAPTPADPAYDTAFLGGLNQNVKTLTSAVFNANPRYGRPGSYHPGGFNVALCDASTQWIGETIDYGVYAALMTSRGERANNPAATSFTKAFPWWQNPAAANYYPGTAY